ncbi:MAG TPA: GTPase Era [Candidatus Binatia bacterium]
MSAAAPHRAGFVTLVGRPNVGKSTLLNCLVGTKLAAVSAKPQTTRNRIVGIATRPGAQIVLVDTPGIHAGSTPLNSRMVATARQSLGDADVAVLVVDGASGLVPGDREVVTEVGRRARVVAVNKTDSASQGALLATCAEVARLLPDAEVVPVSALTGDNVERLVELVVACLPEGPILYPADQVSEQSERFLASEIIREKIIEQTRDELPYTTAVVIDAFREEPTRDLLVIQATVLVERATQKGIVIGERGRRIRDIGQAARLELEAVFSCRVFLELYVKVVREWSKDPRVLRELGL